jgi:hypothetical protein
MIVGGPFPAIEVGQTRVSKSAGAPLPPLTHLVKTAAIFLALWALPVGAVLLLAGPDSVWFQEAMFFTQAAFVTIGGAYAVLSYISHVAVNNYGWLDAHQMVQGLGLAESTPGPLIMVTQYVGFMGPGTFLGVSRRFNRSPTDW